RSPHPRPLSRKGRGGKDAVVRPARSWQNTAVRAVPPRESAMPYSTAVRGERVTFADLRELFAKANEEKSGDQLASLAAAGERERVAAKRALADVPLGEILNNPLLDPDRDDVSRLILETHDTAAFREVASLTVGELREQLLDGSFTDDRLRR